MNWLALGLKIIPLIIGAVNAVERLVKSAKGQDKQDAAVDLVATMLGAVEDATSKDLLNDAAVQLATRAVINAVVEFQNVLATRAAATAGPAAIAP